MFQCDIFIFRFVDYGPHLDLQLPKFVIPTYIRHTCMKQLNLSSNNITDEQVDDLCSVLPSTCIEVLDLSSNAITEKGVLQLIIFIPKSKVHTLNVENNFLSQNSYFHIFIPRKEDRTEIFEKLHITLKKSGINFIDLSKNNLGNI